MKNLEKFNEDFLKEILQYEQDLYYRASSYCKGSESDAFDLVQDTILKALSNEDKFKKGTNLRAWLMTIEYHLFVNRFRRRKRYWDIKEKHRSTLARLNSHDSIVSDPVCEIEADRIMQILKDELEDIFYEVFQVVEVEGRAYKEAALYLDIPVGTVMSRLYRARKKAQAILLEIYDESVLSDLLGTECIEEAKRR